MKILLILIMITLNFTYAEYIVKIDLDTLFGNSISFENETTPPTSEAYKVNITLNFNGANTSASHPNYVNLMLSNWIDETAYFVIESKNFDGLKNASFKTQSTGPHPLIINRINSFDDDRYLYSLTSNDPSAPPFEMGSEEYDYVIEFEVINKS